MTCPIRIRLRLRRAESAAIAFLLVGFVLLAHAPHAHATTISVTTTNDELNGDADCSLREAVQAANTNATVSGCAAGNAADTITVPAGTYTLTLIGARENANATGDLDVLGDVTINGAGANLTLIDGNGTDRELHVLAGIVVVHDAAFQNGLAPQGAAGENCINEGSCFEFAAAGEDGGGILTASGSNLTLRRVTVADNDAGAGGDAGDINCPAVDAECETVGGDGGQGGGVAGKGALTIEHSLVTGNRSGSAGSAGSELACGGDCFTSAGNHGDGGGVIISDGGLNLRTTTVDDNESVDWAGGVYCHHGSTCAIQDSTIVGNRAAFRGGGLTGIGATVTVVNTTITGNQATGPGGGVSVFSGTIDLDFVTVAGNSAGNDGGGLERESFGTLTMRNSIVADNTGAAGPDCSNTIVSGGYNHVENLTGCTMTLVAGDVTGSDPNLLDLADNGGATQTHALGLPNPAMETIPNGTSGCGTAVTADQRGEARPSDADVSGTAACDKGAFEIESPEPGYPFLTDVRKCQEAIAKVGGKYFTSRHNALASCRSTLMKGKPIFEDALKASPLTRALNCASEYKTAGKITKARQKLRTGLDKGCTDAILATLQSCGTTIAALAGATGSSGCLIEAVDANVNALIAEEYGY